MHRKVDPSRNDGGAGQQAITRHHRMDQAALNLAVLNLATVSAPENISAARGNQGMQCQGVHGLSPAAW
jgi:hypothetical protein